MTRCEGGRETVATGFEGRLETVGAEKHTPDYCEITVMKTGIRVFKSLLLAAFVGAVLVVTGPMARAHDGPHEAVATGGYARSLQTYVVPDVALINADAQPVSLRNALAAEGPVMVNFIFTTCGAICPVMSATFAKVPGKLGATGDKLRMISISIDPENDTPAELKAYAKTYHATSRWQFLTGSPADIQAVQQAFHSYRGDKMNHAPLAFLRYAPGQPWLRIEGFASADDLAREYRSMVAR